MDYISMVFISHFDTFKCSNMVILAKNAIVHFVMYFCCFDSYMQSFQVLILGGRNYTKVSNNNGNTVKLHTAQAKNHASTHNFNPRTL